MKKTNGSLHGEKVFLCDQQGSLFDKESELSMQNLTVAVIRQRDYIYLYICIADACHNLSCKYVLAVS